MSKRNAADSTGFVTMKRTQATNDSTTASTAMPKTNDETTTDNHQEVALSLVERLRNALATPDSSSANHAELLADISRLQLVVENPLDTIYRIGHQVIGRLRDPHRCHLTRST